MTAPGRLQRGTNNPTDQNNSETGSTTASDMESVSSDHTNDSDLNGNINENLDCLRKLQHIDSDDDVNDDETDRFLMKVNKPHMDIYE